MYGWLKSLLLLGSLEHELVVLGWIALVLCIGGIGVGMGPVECRSLDILFNKSSNLYSN